MVAMELIVTIGAIETMVTIKATTATAAKATITDVESTETIASIKPYASENTLA